ncbi:RNA-binding S4 domain-containing protein [Leptolyngbya sp. BC1307]|uniref:RNA-binding S4 domain-containing protein n=1 Tax=Leptolyngbya sp. BC1307 TaxID=2029589 RepID=UPI000EFBC3C1|nr:RNA-binding S4 domain-containing protein [Leptolyngbya sp. BC1307]
MTAEFIKLDQFLKVTDVAQSGGEAKLLIRSGEVSVNGEMELRRGRKLYDQDVVTVDEVSFTVQISPTDEAE